MLVIINYFRYNVIANDTTMLTSESNTYSRVNSLKSEIWKKLNILLEKQERLKEENNKDKHQKLVSKLDHQHLEDGTKAVEVELGDENTEERPFLLHDIVESDEEALVEVNRNRRKNRQRKDEFISAALETDQSHSESITLHSVQKTPKKFPNHHHQADPYGVKNDIRLEIPISLDATISLPKNKESLEELLDFVMRHDAALLQNYLQQKHGADHHPRPQSPHHGPQDHHQEHSTVPDILHNSYAALRPLHNDHDKLSPTTQESNHCLCINFIDFTNLWFSQLVAK